MATPTRHPVAVAAAVAFIVYCIMTAFAYNDLVAHQPRIPPPSGGITSLAPNAAFIVGFYYAVPAFVLVLIVIGVVDPIVTSIRGRRDRGRRTI
jgi:hypothetical protein